jgi:NodT family efflux transporter outer membrane factor (OMF) lipoprotein
MQAALIVKQRPKFVSHGLAALVLLLLCGCTPCREYLRNGFKVGPNYGRPPAPVAQQWIDANDKRVQSEEDANTMCQWWGVFNDPILNDLICTAYHQNLTLRQAGFRVLEARAQLGIAIGNIFPQTQNASGNYMAIANSQETARGGAGGGFGPQFFNQWNFGFNLAWELDFWGRFRRAVEQDSDLLDASVEDYDGALVTLLGDIATTYANMRTFEQRIKYARDNVKIQQNTLSIVEARFKVSTISELDVDQARTTLEATEAAISELEISYRESIVQLCILMGMPPEDLITRIGLAPIPSAPTNVAVGIPADLLRRRPDVRAAERRLAAQCAAIGIAESEFYPHVSIDGTLGWSAQNLGHLFESSALNGSAGPSFTWNLLNYGRILNDVRFQNALFQELLAAYQNSVLTANQDVENGLVTFLRGQERTGHQQASVDAAVRAVNIAIKQYEAGTTDFTTVTQVEQIQVQQQDLLAQAQGEIATGLIQIYRALGGGWQIRLTDCNLQLPPPGAANVQGANPETVPSPKPPSPQELPTPPAKPLPENSPTPISWVQPAVQQAMQPGVQFMAQQIPPQNPLQQIPQQAIAAANPLRGAGNSAPAVPAANAPAGNGVIQASALMPIAPGTQPTNPTAPPQFVAPPSAMPISVPPQLPPPYIIAPPPAPPAQAR